MVLMPVAAAAVEVDEYEDKDDDDKRDDDEVDFDSSVLTEVSMAVRQKGEEALK